VERLGARWRPEAAERFEELYEIGDDGAVLVRPDGHVGWRLRSGKPSEATLRDAVMRILHVAERQ
jgi:hypothetical protein